jgi:hypothetical protein
MVVFLSKLSGKTAKKREIVLPVGDPSRAAAACRAMVQVALCVL